VDRRGEDVTPTYERAEESEAPALKREPAPNPRTGDGTGSWFPVGEGQLGTGGESGGRGRSAAKPLRRLPVVSRCRATGGRGVGGSEGGGGAVAARPRLGGVRRSPPRLMRLSHWKSRRRQAAQSAGEKKWRAEKVEAL